MNVGKVTLILLSIQEARATSSNLLLYIIATLSCFLAP
jgi:hypothetical protein